MKPKHFRGLKIVFLMVFFTLEPCVLGNTDTVCVECADTSSDTTGLQGWVETINEAKKVHYHSTFYLI